MNSGEYRPSRVKNPGAEDEVEIHFADGDAGCIHRRGQPALHAGHAILHVHGGNVEVVASLEGGGDGAGAAVGAGGTDVAHSLDAVDGLFKGNGDGFFNGIGIGANIVAVHANHRRRRRVGIHGDRADWECTPLRRE